MSRNSVILERKRTAGGLDGLWNGGSTRLDLHDGDPEIGVLDWVAIHVDGEMLMGGVATQFCRDDDSPGARQVWVDVHITRRVGGPLG